MPGTIAVIKFDQKSFPVSPAVQLRQHFDTAGRIVFRCSGATGSFNEYVHIPRKAEITLPELEEGRYALSVSLEGEGINQAVVFGFSSIATGEKSKTEIRVDLQDYERENGYSSEIIRADAGHETRLKKIAAYFEEAFSGKISCDEEFWAKFARMMEVALVPVQAQVRAFRDGHGYRPVHVEYVATLTNQL